MSRLIDASSFRRWFVFASVLAFAMALPLATIGCNATRGLGQDLEEAADNTQDAINEAAD